MSRVNVRFAHPHPRDRQYEESLMFVKQSKLPPETVAFGKLIASSLSGENLVLIVCLENISQKNHFEVRLCYKQKFTSARWGGGPKWVHNFSTKIWYTMGDGIINVYFKGGNGYIQESALVGSVNVGNPDCVEQLRSVFEGLKWAM